jgi:anti-sigma B factor antagonist
MPLKCDQYNQVCVMSLDGDFSAEMIASARKEFESRVEQHHTVDFVVDFEKSGFVDSEGLELLLWMKRKCEDMFGQVKLVALDDNVRKILEITRLQHRFECHKDLTAAVKNMR